MFITRLVTGLSMAMLSAFAPAWGQTLPAQHCTNASIRGKYGFLTSGTTFAAAGLQAAMTGAFVSKGTAEYDGQGHITATVTSSFNGFVQGPAALTGTYQVNSDCSLTSHWSNGNTFRSVIVNGGSDLLILQTNTGVAVAGTAQYQVRGFNLFDDNFDFRFRSCTASSLAGHYGVLEQGSAGAPALPGVTFGPLTGVGTLALNADGTFKMAAQRSVGGVIDAQLLALAGKFTVGSDCTYKLIFDAGYHYDAISTSRDEAILIQTDAGTAVTLRVTKQ